MDKLITFEMLITALYTEMDLNETFENDSTKQMFKIFDTKVLKKINQQKCYDDFFRVVEAYKQLCFEISFKTAQQLYEEGIPNAL